MRSRPNQTVKTRPPRYDAARLARERDEQGMTNVMIASAIRRDQSVVARTLSGHRQYQSPATVKAIADFLRVPMSEITISGQETGA